MDGWSTSILYSACRTSLLGIEILLTEFLAYSLAKLLHYQQEKKIGKKTNSSVNKF